METANFIHQKCVTDHYIREIDPPFTNPVNMHGSYVNQLPFEHLNTKQELAQH